MSETSKARKILVVDDEMDTVIYMETLLQDNGYETVSANNGEEGLRVARAERPDLILLDVTMPEKSGMRFYKELKSDPEYADIPIFFVTGVTGHGGDSAAFERFIGSRKGIPKPEGFFGKPIDREEFLKAVAKLFE